MNRRHFVGTAALALALPALAATPRFERGLLWRVTGKSAPASHVYGTLHAADARLAEFPSVVQHAVGAARSVMLEFVPDGYGRERFMQAALFADRETLEQKIGSLDFERAVAALGPLGLSRDLVNRMKPWSVLVNLQARQTGQAPGPDERLRELARARGVPTYQIENVDEQVFTFDEFPMDSQIALLKHSLAHGTELAALAAQTVEAYLAEDLSAIWRLREQFGARHPEIAAHQAVMTKRVVHDRSVVMAFRMQRELRRGDAFVALGAVHLYGSKGVLALLQADGYRAVRAS